MRVDHLKNDNQPVEKSAGLLVRDIIHKSINKKSLYIGIPTYTGKPSFLFCISITNTILELYKNKIDFQVNYLPYESTPETARNKITQTFLETNYTHLLMIDDDQSWEADKIIEMLCKDQYILAAPILKKTKETEWNLKLETNSNNEILGDNDMVFCEWIGSGLIMIKRETFLIMDKKLQLKKTTYYGAGYSSYFEHDYIDNIHYSEDANFCRRWKSIGGDVLAFPNITMGHVGNKVWAGNYHNYLIDYNKNTFNFNKVFG